MAAELHCAWVWDCDECGAENFERAVEGDATEAALMMARDSEPVVMLQAEEANCSMGEPDVDGMAQMETPELITAIALSPKHVVCKSCGKTFDTEISQLEG